MTLEQIKELDAYDLRLAFYEVFKVQPYELHMNNDGKWFKAYDNWDDVMPLAVENELNIDFYGRSTDCTRFSSLEDGMNTFASQCIPDPLRAICEVLLMIKLSE